MARTIDDINGDNAANSDMLARVVGHLNCYVDPHLAYLMSATPEQRALAAQVMDEIAKLKTYVGEMAREHLGGAEIRTA